MRVTLFLLFLFLKMSLVAQDTSPKLKMLKNLEGTWMKAADTTDRLYCHSIKGGHLECFSSDSSRIYISWSDENQTYHAFSMKRTGGSTQFNGHLADDRLVLTSLISKDGRTEGARMILVFVKGQLHIIEESKYNHSAWQQVTDYYLVRIN